MKRIGIVEGFYGNPWSYNKRLDLLRILGEKGFNTYIYAPKDDPYHRDRWREEYPEAELSDLVDTINVCKKSGLEFFFTLSPGGNVTYSSGKDLERVVDRLKFFFDLGVRSFGLFFDDIAFKLTEGLDKERFGTIEKAQNWFLLEVYKRVKEFGANTTLSTCPTLYHGRGDEEYIKGFVKGLPQDLLVFWTGREVCSQVLSKPDADLFFKNTGHRPIYWDNYPVNDSIMKWELHLGPYDKRDRDLLDSCDGIILNPMEYAYSSLIPLTTVIDFYKDPQGYKRIESWERSVREWVGESLYKPFIHFASYCFKSCIYPYFSNKILMAELMEGMNREEWNCGDYLYDEGVRGLKYSKILLEWRDHRVVSEVLPWIRKYRLLMKMFVTYRKRRTFLGSIKYKLLLRAFLLDRYEIFQLDVFNEIDKK